MGILDRFNTFTLLMHNNPDGDSVASMFFMKKVLEKKNKKVQLAIHNKIPENFKFWFEKYVNIIDIPKSKSECLIIIDTPNKEKTYDKFSELADYTVVVDHHKNAHRFGDLNIIKPAACTGIILYELAIHMDIRIDKQMSEYLFISLCWDTDGFKNNFSTSYVYEIASKLIALGAVPQRVFRYLFEYRKKNEIQIQKFLFNNIQQLASINYIKLSRKDTTFIDNIDIYNFLNYIKSLDTIGLFIIFIDRDSFFEIRLNNNPFIYKYLKNRFNRLYRINIKETFEKDVEEILKELKELYSKN